MTPRGGTDTLTIHLHPAGCPDNGYSNPTGAEIYEWAENHNTVVGSETVATDIEFIYMGEPLAESFSRGSGSWKMFWTDSGDYLYFRVYANGNINCGIEG